MQKKNDDLVKYFKRRAAAIEALAATPSIDEGGDLDQEKFLAVWTGDSSPAEFKKFAKQHLHTGRVMAQDAAYALRLCDLAGV